MKIVQVAHALTYGDAASNQVISLDKLFKSMNIESEIYAGKIDAALTYPARRFSELQPSRDVLLIYHFSTGTSFVKQILAYPYPIALYYHNITPARYFFGNAWGSFIASIKGRKQLMKLKEKAFFSWAASEYSRQELEEYGFKNTAVLPILVDFEVYKQAQINQGLVDKYHDSLKFLCVGRVTPHKKQEEAIKTLYYYKNFLDENVKLFIVGGAKKSYLEDLKDLAKYLKVEHDVIFTGKVSFNDLCTYYQIADAVLSMSEHEGFCVPLVESMFFKKPVFAKSCTAVPFTMGSSGVLIENGTPALTAEIISHILNNKSLLNSVVEKQAEQLRAFSEQQISRQIIDSLNQLSKLNPKGDFNA